MAFYFIGIDVGTQGARVVMLNTSGAIISSAEEVFPLSEASRQEQSPLAWWNACKSSLLKMLRQSGGIDPDDIVAISVSSTSGTVIPLDNNQEPLYNAIMYSDNRSTEQAKKCTAAALEDQTGGYTAFNTSSGLSKMVWFADNFPEKNSQIGSWIHAADYITGKICGRWGITDYTNALKSGFDLTNLQWPEYLVSKLGLKKEWLPEVVPPGTVIGSIEPQLAKQLGLPLSLKVTAGITDGCASQIASGAVKPGEWNTTIGTTMVIKGVTKKEVKDPLGRIYNHRHPEGYWMPGGASNTGADWVTTSFGDDLADFDKEARKIIPTNYQAYPLTQEGERFPFISAKARGFAPQELTRTQLFTANMEGVAYLERYSYELITQLSGEMIEGVYTAGGASNSDTWLIIRSNVLKKPLYKMKYISGAVGAAILAASNTAFNSLTNAVKSLTIIDREVHPGQDMALQYDALYKNFLNTLQQKGYIEGGLHA